MGDSYENTQMPEKPEDSVNPDAIPVDDKGRPLPDPTENFRDYIAPSGLETLKQTYEAVEEDEGVKETMEPPQQTTFFKKHRSGRRSYDYYGTPAGSVPNDTNGVKPSALSELFSAAEAVEVDAVEPDEDEQFKAFDPIQNIEKSAVIATPDQKEMQAKAVSDTTDPRDAFIRAGYTTADDEVFKKNEVKRDTSTPRILDYYKDSTNTKVIFESESSENNSSLSSTDQNASDLFNNTAPLTKAQIRAAKRAEKKAKKEKARLLRQQAKAKRKAEKAQRKAELKAKKSGTTFGNMPAFDIKDTTPAHPQSSDVNTTPDKETVADNSAELAQRQAKEIAEKARLEKEAAEKEAKVTAEKLKLEKEAAEKARLEKEAAERLARETAQEAENKLRQEQEAIQRHKEEIKLAKQKHSEAEQKLEEEKAAAQKAKEEAELARQEAEKAKAELELMKEAAAKALEQKKMAEEAAKKAKEENERLEAEANNQKRAKSAQEEKFRQERDEAIAKAKAEKDEAIAKAKAEKDAAIAKAKAEKDAAIAKAKSNHTPKQKSKNIYSHSSKMSDENGQNVYSSTDIYIGSAPKKAPDIEEIKKDLSLLIDKTNIVSRSSKKEIAEDDKSKK